MNHWQLVEGWTIKWWFWTWCIEIEHVCIWFFLCIKVFLYIQRFMHMCIFIFVYIHTYKYTYFLSTYVCCVYCVSSICLFPGYGYVFCQGKDYRLVSPSALESTRMNNGQFAQFCLLGAREIQLFSFLFASFSQVLLLWREGRIWADIPTNLGNSSFHPVRIKKNTHTHTHFTNIVVVASRTFRNKIPLKRT